MFENISRCSDAANEQLSESEVPASTRGVNVSCDARRRIERLTELRHLRTLLDDPEFDDLD